VTLLGRVLDETVEHRVPFVEGGRLRVGHAPRFSRLPPKAYRANGVHDHGATARYNGNDERGEHRQNRSEVRRCKIRGHLYPATRSRESRCSKGGWGGKDSPRSEQIGRGPSPFAMAALAPRRPIGGGRDAGAPTTDSSPRDSTLAPPATTARPPCPW
jgi:hypothetical protein